MKPDFLEKISGKNYLVHGKTINRGSKNYTGSVLRQKCTLNTLMLSFWMKFGQKRHEITETKYNILQQYLPKRNIFTTKLYSHKKPLFSNACDYWIQK